MSPLLGRATAQSARLGRFQTLQSASASSAPRAGITPGVTSLLTRILEAACCVGLGVSLQVLAQASAKTVVQGRAPTVEQVLPTVSFVQQAKVQMGAVVRACAQHVTLGDSLRATALPLVLIAMLDKTRRAELALTIAWLAMLGKALVATPARAPAVTVQ